MRVGLRYPSILQYVKPNPLRYPQPHRTLTNSTMAPKQYKTPPQLPPKFTATKQSLLDDTKRLVCQIPLNQSFTMQ
jgi:metallopeptidase MepB